MNYSIIWELNTTLERSHRGLVRWFAKPVRVSKPFEGSNPSLSAKIGIEQILDEKIIAKEKADKAVAARAAIQKAHGKLNNS